MNAHTLHACAGEAQKIDRIMEKFAERYCRDNPGRFRSADGAYLLAFAIIMLNTDAHNPLAEARLRKQDFVAMGVHVRARHSIPARATCLWLPRGARRADVMPVCKAPCWCTSCLARWPAGA